MCQVVEAVLEAAKQAPDTKESKGLKEDCLRSYYRITESQNSRGWKGPLWVIWSSPSAGAGSPTAGCTGPCPGRA